MNLDNGSFANFVLMKKGDFQILKDLTQKVAGKVPNKTVKETLKEELGKI